jgi:hypothetical protein
MSEAKGRALIAQTFERHAAAMEKASTLSKEERANLLLRLKKLGKGGEDIPQRSLDVAAQAAYIQSKKSILEERPTLRKCKQRKSPVPFGVSGQ